jgi:tRNA(fMet)-specific endonuclease VapC
MVIDTSLFIEHLRAPDKMQTTLATLPSGTAFFISSVTIYELYCGVKEPSQAEEIELLTKRITELPFDKLVAIQAGLIYYQLRKRNKLICTGDILIAATALVYNQPVKTLNVKDFSRIDGLSLL